MKEEVARALDALAGPLVAQGLELGIAERVAKIRAFREGTYDGEVCDRCGQKAALLDPWGPTREFPDKWEQRLCDVCSGAEARERHLEEVARAAAKGEQP